MATEHKCDKCKKVVSKPNLKELKCDKTLIADVCQPCLDEIKEMINLDAKIRPSPTINPKNTVSNIPFMSGADGID